MKMLYLLLLLFITMMHNMTVQVRVDTAINLAPARENSLWHVGQNMVTVSLICQLKIRACL